MAKVQNSLMRREVPLGPGYGRQDIWHAHLDIKGETPLSGEELELLQKMKNAIYDECNLVVDDQPFCRLQPHHYEQVRAVSSDVASILSDSSLYGEPLAHWTLKTGHAQFVARELSFINAFDLVSVVAAKLNRPAYVEVERVKRMVFPALSHVSELWPVDYPEIAVTPFELVALKSIGREFRDTEVHVTIEELDAADPRVLIDLFRRLGFRIAHRARADGGMSLIGTAQGFDPDISLLFLECLAWAKKVQEAGSVRCDITVKMEDIVWHRVMNDPYILPVIAPGSLRRL